MAQIFRRMIGADHLWAWSGSCSGSAAGQILKEYNVPITLRASISRWPLGRLGDRKELERFISALKMEMAEDKYGDPVYLAQSQWWLQRTQRDWPKIAFYATKERH